MELKMNQVQIPEKITFNYEELKAEIMEAADLYASIVYGEDEIKQAKVDKAKFGRLKKALNDERIRQEREYMKPFTEFKAQVNEIIGIIDKPIAIIDEQIKAYDDKQKSEKLDKIKEYWESTDHPEWLKCNQIFDQRWLNTTFTMKKVQEAINERLAQIETDLNTLETLSEFAFEAAEVYRGSLDINRAIAEGHRLADIQRRKEEAAAAAEAARQAEEAEKERLQKEAETQKATAKINAVTSDGEEQPIGAVDAEVPAKMWVGFEALLSVEEARMLRAFFNQNSIDFRMIQKEEV